MERDMKKLNRTELIEIVYQLRVELDRVNAEGAALRSQMNDMQEKLSVSRSGEQMEEAAQQVMRRLEQFSTENEKRRDERVHALERENAALRNKLLAREKMALEAGSIAEATARINDIYAHAQQTADDYLENVRRSTICGEEIIANAQAKANEMIRAAEEKVNAGWEEFRAKLDILTRNDEKLRQMVEIEFEEMETD